MVSTQVVSLTNKKREYFASLIKPLVKNESLKSPLGTFLDKIMKIFSEKVSKKNDKIKTHTFHIFHC